MTISFVLATVGRTDEVAAFFRSLANCAAEGVGIQMIVADQNEDGRLDDIMAALPPAWEVAHVKTKSHGVSAARNEVLGLVHGDFVAFPDDDCEYRHGTIANVLAAFSRHLEVDAVLGMRDGDKANVSAGLVNRYALFKRGEMFLQFYRAEAVKRIGAFDESFGPGPDAAHPFGGDDSDYLARCALGGGKILRVPDVRVWHPEPSADFDRVKTFGYGRVRMALLKKLRYPLWFRLANVAYPLAMALRHPGKIAYYMTMFKGRVHGEICGRSK